jgi:hypothetical protein
MTLSDITVESQGSAVELEEAESYIAQLDLTYIVKAMCAPDYPMPRWTLEDAEHSLVLYKNFLMLLKEYPREGLVPTREIDEFWHNHILYTKNYHRDCLHIFGHYLHHEPASPADNPEKLIDAYLKTKQYYLEKFKHPLVAAYHS